MSWSRCATHRDPSVPIPSARRGGPTGALDPLEARPGGCGEVVGEGLEVPGTAAGVDHPADVGLVGEQELGVAGESAAEALGQTEHGVERQHGDGVGPAERGTERREGAAQDVDPRVLAGEHPQARHGMGASAAVTLGHTAQLADPGPDATQGPQCGRGEELVRRRADPELDLPEGRGERDAGRLQVPHVGDPRGHRSGQRVDVGGAGVVEDGGVDRDGPPARACLALLGRGRRAGRGRGWCRAGRLRRAGRGRGSRRRRGRSPTWSSRAWAASTWWVCEETTTGARSRRTSARASGRSATATPSSPTCNHTEVTPCSRSSSTAALVAPASGSSCR